MVAMGRGEVDHGGGVDDGGVDHGGGVVAGGLVDYGVETGMEESTFY